jgi:hypothetical protein
MINQVKRLFLQISKVDEEKRTVTGIGASEALDAEGEIFDYASSKPYIEAWSAGAFVRSQGKSYGNIREMHQLSAVGKLSEPVVFDDAQKLVILTSFISDDAAWTKCLDGTYTGFSICGPVIGDKWSDPDVSGAKRFTCSPIEWSVCDLPCNETAVFTAVKAGGASEQRKFKTATAVEKEPIVAKNTEVVVEKAGTKGLDAISKCMKALNSVSGCMDGKCEHGGIHECAEAISKAHKTASAAMNHFADDSDEDSEGKKPSEKAAIVPKLKGASPETGEQLMNETEKAQLAKAQEDAAASLTLAKETNEAVKALGESFVKGFEGIAKALGSEPVALKSAGAGALAVVTKEGEGGKKDEVAVDPKDPASIAKSILSKPKAIAANELNIGR